MKFFESIKPWTSAVQLNYMFLVLILFNQLFQTLATTTDDIKLFEQSLKQHDYKEALLQYDKIKSNKNDTEDVISTIYKESNNIDLFLHFTSLISDINERAAMYESIYNLIIKNGGLTMYTGSYKTDRIRIQTLYVCNTMKFISKIHSTVLQFLNDKSDQYKKTLNHVEDIKNDLGEKMKKELFHLNNHVANITNVKYKSTNEHLKCMLVLKDSNIVFKQYEILLNNTDTDKIDCSLIVTDGTNDIAVIKKLLKLQNLYDRFKTDFSYKYNYSFDETEEFENALIQKDFNLALLKYNAINNDSLSSIILKKLYRQFYNLNDLIYFASLVTNKNNGNLNVIKAIVEVAFDNDKFSVCEVIKVIDILQYLRFKQPQHDALIQFTDELKLNLSNAIVDYEESILYQSLQLPSENPDTYLIKINKSYAYDIYDKNGEIHLGKIEYILNRLDNETLCYFRGFVSITNYDYWYLKNYLLVVNWFTFIILVTKFC